MELNTERLSTFLKKLRHFRLEQLRMEEQRLNKRGENLKLERRRLRLNELWYGDSKTRVGREVWQVAMEKRSLREEIKQEEDASKDV